MKTNRMHVPSQQLGFDFSVDLHGRKKNNATTLTGPNNDAIPQYQLIRSKRRSLSIGILRGKVVVRAPMRAPLYWINQAVSEKASWINRQLAIEHKQLNEIYRINHGTTVVVLGRPLTISVRAVTSMRANRKPVLRELDDALIIEHSTNHKANFCSITSEHWSTRLFFDWIKAQAGNYMSAQTQHLAKASGLAHSLGQVNYRRTRSKWGHCTSNGDIQYNPLIILAPQWVVDYIIAHEVCHLQHRNHSKRYWKLVEKVFPKYKQAEKWLVDHGHRLAIEAPQLPKKQ